MPALNDHRILHYLKTRGAQRAKAVADNFAISSVAARKQLIALEAKGLVHQKPDRGKPGRPAHIWTLTGKADSRFPDTHDVLTLDLIKAARQAFGEAGMDRLIAVREAETLQSYLRACARCSTPRERVAKLAALRSQEGYMAEVEVCADGSFLMIENHCPICTAAQACQGLCRSELHIFQKVFGGIANVERTQHILAGARRCAYRIVPNPASTP